MIKFINILVICIFLFLNLSIGTPAVGAPAQQEISEVPSNASVFHIDEEGVLVFHIDKEGVLAYQNDNSSLKTHLLKSKSLTSKFTPIDVFEDASPMMTTCVPLPNSPVFVYGKMKGKKKFAVYVLNGRGEVINEVPGTERYSEYAWDRPFVVVPDMLSPLTFYVLQALHSPQGYAGGFNTNLQEILMTSDGGKSFKKVSLPGKTPVAIEGIVFNPKNINELWVWRSSTGYWEGVEHSTDGGISWHNLNIDVEGGIYGLIYNPITNEVVVLRKNLPSTTVGLLSIANNKVKITDLKGNPSSKRDSYVRVLLFDKERKSIIVPVFCWYKCNGNVTDITGEIYSYSEGECKKIADVPEVEGDIVYGGFISPNTFFLSFENYRKSIHNEVNEVVVYTLSNTRTHSKFKTFSILALIAFLLCFFAIWMFLKKEVK